MIFVCVGSRGYQFNRLLQALDALVEKGEVCEKIFAQTGNSDYKPLHYSYARYLDEGEFRKYQDRADIIISHGGTGALVSALKKRKQVIAVPRMVEFGEHIDDHQQQVTEALAKQGYLLEVRDMADLGKAIRRIQTSPINKYFDLPSHVIDVIDSFIQNEIVRSRAALVDSCRDSS